jgi:hypothetical protein
MSLFKDALGWIVFLAPLGGFVTGFRDGRRWEYVLWPCFAIVAAILFWPGADEPNDTAGLSPVIFIFFAFLTVGCEAAGDWIRRRRS